MQTELKFAYYCYGIRFRTIFFVILAVWECFFHANNTPTATDKFSVT